MKEKKYKEDWVNESRLDDCTGKETRVPVYQGPRFRGMDDREKKSILLWSIFPWIFFLALIILYFRLFFPGSTVLYVFLPAALSLFPALYWAIGIMKLFRIFRKKGEYACPGYITRLDRVTGPERILRSSAGCMICAFAAFLGDAVFMITGSQATREWPGAAMLLAASGTALGTMNYFRKVNAKLERQDEEK